MLTKPELRLGRVRRDRGTVLALVASPDLFYVSFGLAFCLRLLTYPYFTYNEKHHCLLVINSGKLDLQLH